MAILTLDDKHERSNREFEFCITRSRGLGRFGDVFATVLLAMTYTSAITVTDAVINANSHMT